MNGKRGLSPVVVNLLFMVGLLFVTTMTGGCIEVDNSGHREGSTMRNEIIEYVKSLGKETKGPQVDVTHIVEKYIKMGESYEAAKEVLLNNGFLVHEYSVEEARNRKDVKITYRMEAGLQIAGSWSHRRDIQIFLGTSPQSESVDRVLAKVNLKTL